MPTEQENFLLSLCPLPVAFVCGRTRFSPKEIHVTRYNPDYILLFMLRNTLWFTEDGKETRLEAGEWYMQLPGVFQSGLRPSPGAEYYFIHFRPSVLSAADQPLPFSCQKQTALRLPLRGRYEGTALLPLLEQLYHRNGRPDDFLGQELLFLQILDTWIKTAAQGSGERRPNEVPLAQRIMTVLCSGYTGPLDKTALEREFHYTYDHLCRVFRREYGQTPLQYLAGLRNRWARELLVLTDKPLGDIAGQMGYANAFAFSKHFRQNNGLSPSDFRREHRKRKDT
jgi:AraC-like DNA-binding protein